jgi:hypothetical protein
MLITEITESRDSNRKDKREIVKYTPPVYPEVDMPVPELDWSKLRGKEHPWYMRLAAGIISSIVSISETLNMLIKHRRI